MKYSKDFYRLLTTEFILYITSCIMNFLIILTQSHNINV